ncbi:MAG: hypothetical protein OHK0012_07500 [Synechococcales cyanobacterium]
MESKLNLIIKAIDQATAPLRNIMAALGNLGGQGKQQVGGLSNSFRDLENTISRSMITTQLLFGAIQKGIGILQGGFNEATQIQLSSISAASTLSAITGRSYAQASAVIDNFNRRLAISAAALPGSTQDYKNLAVAIQDNVVEAFRTANGIDMGKFENTVVNLAESFGALAAASGTSRDVNLFLTKALAGDSIAGLRNLRFAEQNQIVLNQIEDSLKRLNKTSLRELTMRQRVEVLQEIGGKLITEDFKRNASQSVDGLIQSFRSQLFDPTEGIFGVMRDLNAKLAGDQSLFASINKTLNAAIGQAGLFNRLLELGAAFGVAFQPLQPIASAFDWLTTKIDYITGSIRRFNSNLQFRTRGVEILKNDLGFLFTAIARDVGNAVPILSGVANALAKIGQFAVNNPKVVETLLKAAAASLALQAGMGIARGAFGGFIGTALYLAKPLTSVLGYLPGILKFLPLLGKGFLGTAGAILALPAAPILGIAAALAGVYVFRNQIGSFFKGMGEGIVSNLTPAWQGLGRAWNELWTKMEPGLKMWGELLGEAIQWVAKLTGNFEAGSGPLETLGRLAGQAATGGFRLLLEGLTRGITLLIDIGTAIGNLAAWFVLTGEQIGISVANWVLAVEKFFQGVRDWFTRSRDEAGLKVQEMITNITNWLQELPGKMYEAGANIASQLAAGISSAAMAPVDAIKGVADQVSRFVIGRSPIPEGPLHLLHQSKIVDNLAESLKPSPLLISRLAGLTGMMQMGLTPQPMLAGVGVGGGITIAYQPQITINGGGEDLRAQLQELLVTEGERLVAMLERAQARTNRGRF